MYPGKGTVVLIRPAQTFYERINFYQSQAPFMVSADRRSTILTFSLTGTFDEAAKNMDLIFFVSLMITMIGLAVGIDYSLILISRFKEEMGRGHDKREARA